MICLAYLPTLLHGITTKKAEIQNTKAAASNKAVAFNAQTQRQVIQTTSQRETRNLPKQDDSFKSKTKKTSASADVSEKIRQPSVSKNLAKQWASQAQVRLKDITHIEGVRTNFLVGYGLVVGLNGTGDTPERIVPTRESLISMLERIGVNVRLNKEAFRTRNVAAVMVTAELPAFAQPGGKLDVHVSSLGDCKSLQGGMLLVTPLLGADGRVYAVSQGKISTGGFYASGQNGSFVSKNIPTSGYIASGAMIERAVDQVPIGKQFKLNLESPDFTTATRIVQAIHAVFGGQIAQAIDHATVQVMVPSLYHGQEANFIARLEQIIVAPDTAAKVIIDVDNSMVLVTGDVKIAPFAMTIGSLSIRVDERGASPARVAKKSKSSAEDEEEEDEKPVPKKTSSRQQEEESEEEDQKEASTEREVKSYSSSEVQDLLKQANKKMKKNMKKQFAKWASYNSKPNESDGLSFVTATESSMALQIFPGSAHLGDLVQGLNQLGLSSQELIIVMQALKKSGIFQGKIVII